MNDLDGADDDADDKDSGKSA
ncbi:hypothetical protein LCGC14_1957700, partial [marine sediment metagenome]